MHLKFSWASNCPIPNLKRTLVLICGLVSFIMGPSLRADDLDEIRAELKKSREVIESLLGRIETLEANSAASSDASMISQATERIDYLEENVFEIQDRIGNKPPVQVFDGQSLLLGGFLTTQFTTIVGEDNTTSSFNATQFELLIRSDITKEISFFAAQGFLWEADEDFLSDPNKPHFKPHVLRTPLILGSVNYRHNDHLQIEAGRFITPHGIINIEHFPPTLLDLRQPQFLRPFSGQTIFPNFLTGARVHGSRFSENGDGRLSYSLYTGAHVTGPVKEANALHSGLRLEYDFSSHGITIGTNYAHGSRSNAGDYDLVGVDLLYNKGPVLWKTEVFSSFEKAGADDRFAFYTQPSYRINDKWIGFYRFDYLDNGVLPGSITKEHVFGVNFLPISIVRLRGEAIFRDTKEADTLLFQLSSTVSF